MVALARSVHAPLPSRRLGPALAGVGVLAFVVALALFVDLGRPAFWDPGESRYAETVREMLLTRDWLAPTLATARYYDKPAPYFWLIAASFGAFGRSEWAARLPSALAATATIALVVAFAWRRLGRRAALAAGVVLATAVQFAALGRAVRMDMLLTLLTTATVLQAFAVLEPAGDPTGGDQARATWPIWVATAIGVLVKGPVAFLLPVMIVGSYALATRTPVRPSRLRPGIVSLAALAALAAWYVVQAIYTPDYLWTFLVQHNFGRFLGRALAGHREPLLFYVWILPLTFLPWTVLLPGSAWHAVRRARRGDRVATLLLLWCAVPFVFFSVSRAKLATYLLPIFPALALLVAAYVDRVLRAPAATRARAFALPLVVWSVVMAIAAVATPIAVAVAHPSYARPAAAAILLLPFAALGWAIVRRAAWRAAPAAIAVGMLATIVLFYRVGAPIVDDFASLREAAEVAGPLPPDTPIFAYKTRGHSFTYYGGRSLLRVRSPVAAAEALGRPGPTAVLVKRRHVEKVRQHLARPACIWWQSPSGRVLIANVPTAAAQGTALVPGAATEGAQPPAC